MTLSGLRLAASKALKIYRGEESRIFSFFLLHVQLSLVIGMINSVIDPIVVTLRTGQVSFFLYGFAALVLGITGLGYAGVTDRIDKRRLFSSILFISFLVCLGAGLLLFLYDFTGDIPFLFSALFIWRFIVGIVLLMVFWDLAPFYFNARQGKRLFPLLALGGAVGYSGGSLAVVPLTRIFPFSIQLFIISILTLFCIIGFRCIRINFSIIDSPRYRNKTIASELIEGFAAFKSNSFLRAVGWNTIIFGFLSGLIIFTYNSIITARASTGSDAASLMGIQRAGATILQAVILTRVMSQSALGGRHKKELAGKLLFFLLGIAAFAISMAGVADFTRQIEIALMSPAAMAAFAFLPSRYRGRVMVFNNLTAAAAGIFAASVFVAAVSPFVPPMWFIFPIAALMAVRLAFNFILNRRYTALLSENLVSGSRLNLAKIEENTASILRDDELLNRLIAETEKQSESIRIFITSRLAKSAETIDDIARLEPFFRNASEMLKALQIETLSRINYDEYQDIIKENINSPLQAVRTASKLAFLNRLFETGNNGRFEMETDKLKKDFSSLSVSGSSSNNEFKETAELMLKLEKQTGTKIIKPDWHSMVEEKKLLFLKCIARNPGPEYFSLLAENLYNSGLFSAAVSGLKKMPETLLLDNAGFFKELPEQDLLDFLNQIKETHPVFTRELSTYLLNSFLKQFKEKLKINADFLTLFAFMDSRGREIIDAALLVLTDPYPAPHTLCRDAGAAGEKLSALYPELFRLLFDSPGIRQGRYFPLMEKMLDEQLKTLSLIILCLSSISLVKEDERKLGASVCRDLCGRTSMVKQNALEFIETKTDGESKKFLMLYFEPLTFEEKRMRLKPMLKNFSMDNKNTAAELQNYFKSKGSVIYEEIFANA